MYQVIPANGLCLKGIRTALVPILKVNGSSSRLKIGGCYIPLDGGGPQLKLKGGEILVIFLKNILLYSLRNIFDLIHL